MIIDINKEPEQPDQQVYTNIGPAGFRMKVEITHATIDKNGEWVECEFNGIPSLDMFISDLGIEVESTVTEEGLPVRKLSITGLVHEMERDYGIRRQTAGDAGTSPVE